MFTKTPSLGIQKPHQRNNPQAASSRADLTDYTGTNFINKLLESKGYSKTFLIITVRRTYNLLITCDSILSVF